MQSQRRNIPYKYTRQTKKSAKINGPCKQFWIAADNRSLNVIITAARPAYAGTEGCSILLVFFISFFI